MPNLAVVDMTGKEVGTVELSEAIFGIEPNEPAMHRMVVNYLANNRQGTQSALTRSEDSCSTVDTRRYCFRTKAKKLQILG